MCAQNYNIYFEGQLMVDQREWIVLRNAYGSKQRVDLSGKKKDFAKAKSFLNYLFFLSLYQPSSPLLISSKITWYRFFTSGSDFNALEILL